MFSELKKFTTQSVNLELSEEYIIEIDSKNNKVVVKNNLVIITNSNPSIMQIVMLNTGQLVTLEYYKVLIDELISSSKHYILQLEKAENLVSQNQFA